MLILDSLISANVSDRRRALKETMDRTEGKVIAREVSVQVNDDLKGPDEVLEEVQRLANFGMPK